MHFFVSLSSLLLLTLSTDGLSPSRGSCGGTEPCNAEMIEVEDSRINNSILRSRAVAKTEATSTAVTSTNVTIPTVHVPVVPTGGRQNIYFQWWCGIRPCGARIEEREDSGIHHAAVTAASVADTSTTNIPSSNASVTSTTIHTPLPNAMGFFGWWCHTHTCRSRVEAVKKRQINNPNTSNGDLAAPASPQTIPGGTCGDRICPPKSELMGKGPVNNTAMGNITTNITANKNVGHPRIKPAIIWWCGTQVCHPPSVKVVEKRQVDQKASESSESS